MPLKQFKRGDIVTPVRTFTRPAAGCVCEYTFVAGVEYKVSLDTGNMHVEHPQEWAARMLNYSDYFDLTGMFMLVPQKSAAQVKMDNCEVKMAALQAEMAKLKEEL